MSTSAFGVEHGGEHGGINKKADSGELAAGSVAAGAGAYGAARSAKRARLAVGARRGTGILHAIKHQDAEELATHLRGARRDAAGLGALHAAPAVFGAVVVGLGAAAVARSRQRPTAS